MSREKQIEEMAPLDILANDINQHCPDLKENYCGFTHCVACLANALYNAGYRKRSEWISVDERLPEDVYGKSRKQITVLVCTESGKVSTASRQRKFKFISQKCEWVELDTFEWSNRKRVAFWMPLPEAPKMKGGAE